ncbi:MAG: hypothetical protein LBU24_04175 [Methanocalculaceae archaeon]|jgi:hypothetical protein|nr:hypothetical protein [Methanocalculaceae archaeon]
MTNPITGDWEKTVLFAGRMHCISLPNHTGIATGKVLEYDINELFTWKKRKWDLPYLRPRLRTRYPADR